MFVFILIYFTSSQVLAGYPVYGAREKRRVTEIAEMLRAEKEVERNPERENRENKTGMKAAKFLARECELPGSFLELRAVTTREESLARNERGAANAFGSAKYFSFTRKHIATF